MVPQFLSEPACSLWGCRRQPSRSGNTGFRLPQELPHRSDRYPGTILGCAAPLRPSCRRCWSPGSAWSGPL